MAAIGLVLVVASLLFCAVTPHIWHPLVYGILGGLGSSLISAQVDAVVFETYYIHIGIIRGLCFIGQAIGQGIFPHIITALINNYTYSSSYVVLAGIMLQALPAIMMLKVADSVTRPISYSRYSDVSKTYSIFTNGGHTNFYSTELQLDDMSKKSWKSPSDDCVHLDEDIDNEVYDNEGGATITPPPSPEEKRRNIFGVEIMPEIPEESEESEDEHNSNGKDLSSNKKRLSTAIKRLSTMGDNFSEYITKQIRRDSQSSYQSSNGSKEYSEVEVTYETISPVTDVQREEVFNSFSFRCQSAYAHMRRKLWMPSYRVYRLKRRTTYCFYSLNDTFMKPLIRSLSCWRFYPSLMLYFSKLSLTAIALVALPIIATQMQPKISLSEANFLMTLHAFTWICFLLSIPWLAQTPKRNYKYVTLIGLAISTAGCFLVAEAKNHDTFSIGCVVAGLGYGAISTCWETAVREFVGARKWPKIHSTLETVSACLLAVFVLGNSFIMNQNLDLQDTMFVLSIILSVITFIWTILSAVSLYVNYVKPFSFSRRWRL